MAGLRKYSVGLGLIILFALCLFEFTNLMLASNNPAAFNTLNPQINSSLAGLQNDANSLQSLGTSSEALLTQATPSPVYLFLIIYSAFTIPFNFLGFLVTSAGDMLTLVWGIFFGTGSAFSIVTGVITGILIITAVLLILRAIRVGDTEH